MGKYLAKMLGGNNDLPRPALVARAGSEASEDPENDSQSCVAGRACGEIHFLLFFQERLGAPAPTLESRDRLPVPRSVLF